VYTGIHAYRRRWEVDIQMDFLLKCGVRVQSDLKWFVVGRTQ